jgi:ABC-type uncharacterized transport system permease subunit
MLYFGSLSAALIFYLLSLVNLKNNIQLKNLFLFAALISHLFLIYHDVVLNEFNFDFSNALLVVSIVTVIFYLIFNIKMNYQGLEKIVIIPTLVILVFHYFFSHDYSIRNTDSLYYLSHITIAIIAYGLLTYSAVFSIFILFLENNLHKKKISSLFSTDNSLLSMEQFLFTMIGIGFLLLSITIFTGIFFSQEIFNSPFVFNHKTLFGIFSWVFYGYIIYQRQINGLRGRKATKLSLFAFILLILSYFGSKFVFEYLIG